MEEKQIQFTADIPASLKREIELASVNRSISMKAIAEQALRMWLSDDGARVSTHQTHGDNPRETPGLLTAQTVRFGGKIAKEAAELADLLRNGAELAAKLRETLAETPVDKENRRLPKAVGKLRRSARGVNPRRGNPGSGATGAA